MKAITGALRIIIGVIAWLVFAAGIVLTGLGVYDFVMVFVHLVHGGGHTTALMAIGLLHAVDAFLVAIVFFVMALGFFVLFHNGETPLPVRLPEWLRVKNFTQLKIILWEAILTTLVVSWLASLVEIKIGGGTYDLNSLIIPAGILLIALSLFFLKAREK
jgi:Predicted membrane protein